jgi:hypothetical protein
MDTSDKRLIFLVCYVAILLHLLGLALYLFAEVDGLLGALCFLDSIAGVILFGWLLARKIIK